ncbi:diguanylate cyclase [Rhodoferax sp. BLA1]|uniref:diguanylate cyclase n=1 Tax=Rhodoferax sp. BLA1 TaxID=2576062 RepID=UPI0015D3BCC7|nr:diguanylate cyclase [Rhodoferax sp. BLA1]
MVLQDLLNQLQLCQAVLRWCAGPLLVGLLACGASLGWAQAAVPASAAAPQTPAADVVRYCVDPDWPPFEEIDAKGQHVGIAAELLKRVAQRSGVSLQLAPTKNWGESLTASQAGRCQILSFLNQSPKRDAWLVFTDPVLVDENVLITREEHPFVADLASVEGEILALPKGTSVEEWLRRDFPHLRLMLVDTEAQAFEAVNRRQADMTMRSLIVAASTLKREGWFNLKIAGQVPGYGNQLRIGVAKDQTALRDRLNIGVASLTAGERRQIVDQHLALNIATALDTRSLAWLGAVLVAVLLTSSYWIWRLRRVNAQLHHLSRSDALTGLYNRAGFDEIFKRELARAQRFETGLSVILLDIDFFKRINDQLGHTAGDSALRELALLLRAVVRNVDSVARWGGEEFLVICPATQPQQALVLAERILAAVRSHAFGIQQPITVSAGLASLQPGQNPHTLFTQADEALLQAKRQGRDRLVVFDQKEGSPWP